MSGSFIRKESWEGRYVRKYANLIIRQSSTEGRKKRKKEKKNRPIKSLLTSGNNGFEGFPFRCSVGEGGRKTGWGRFSPSCRGEENSGAGRLEKTGPRRGASLGNPIRARSMLEPSNLRQPFERKSRAPLDEARRMAGIRFTASTVEKKIRVSYSAGSCQSVIKKF